MIISSRLRQTASAPVLYSIYEYSTVEIKKWYPFVFGFRWIGWVLFTDAVRMKNCTTFRAFLKLCSSIEKFPKRIITKALNRKNVYCVYSYMCTTSIIKNRRVSNKNWIAYIATSLASFTDEAMATSPGKNLIWAHRPLRFRNTEPMEGFAADRTIDHLILQ